MSALLQLNPCGLASTVPLFPLHSFNGVRYTSTCNLHHLNTRRSRSHIYRAQINQPNSIHSLISAQGKIIISRLSKFCNEKRGLVIHLAALVATVSLQQPALAVTGVNDEEELVWILIQLGIISFFYFLVVPPFIMNWLRVRWYRRNLLEMYVQFMFVFLFFPGILLWAPFLNFRKFPRDPSMKYPWSVPEDPSKIKNAYLKYPFAQPEDYDVD